MYFVAILTAIPTPSPVPVPAPALYSIGQIIAGCITIFGFASTAFGLWINYTNRQKHTRKESTDAMLEFAAVKNSINNLVESVGELKTELKSTLGEMRATKDDVMRLQYVVEKMETKIDGEVKSIWKELTSLGARLAKGNL